MSNGAGSLDGVRVLELARNQAGPRGGMILSDLGAEVIKIENPGGEESRKMLPLVDGKSVYFSVYNRGKKSICLDLRQDMGRKVFFDLLKSADMVLENFRPGTLERMGLGHDELIKVKPDIIVIRVSGFGQFGPYRERPAYDPLGQAMSGLMMLTGQLEGKPIGTAFSLVDRMTALHATIGALAALHHRERTGEGQVVDVCLMDTALTTVEIPMSYYLSTGKEGGESGRPPYVAKDGWVVISTGSSGKLTQALQNLMGKPAPAQPEGGSYFGRHNPALVEWCKERTVAEIVKELLAIGIPVAPVLSIPQAVQDRHLWEREMMVKLGNQYLPGLAIKLSKTPGNIGPVPEPGQHTQEILSQLYTSAEIEQLQSLNVI